MSFTLSCRGKVLTQFHNNKTTEHFAMMASRNSATCLRRGNINLFATKLFFFFFMSCRHSASSTHISAIWYSSTLKNISSPSHSEDVRMFDAKCWHCYAIIAIDELKTCEISSLKFIINAVTLSWIVINWWHSTLH